MALDRDTLDFLKKELPRVGEQDLERAFERVFSDQFGAGFVDAKEGKEKDNLIQLAVNALKKAQDRIEALPSGAKTRLLAEHQADVERISDVRCFLEDEHALARVWHKNHPETGKRDWRAHSIADAVHLALTDLGVTPTFGTSGGFSPSTAYGRIVQRAFEYHRVKADWRRPAEHAFKAYRQ